MTLKYNAEFGAKLACLPVNSLLISLLFEGVLYCNCLGYLVPAGPPGQPKVTGTAPTAISLSWDKPTDDGGGKIEGYIIEVKPKDGEWTDATPFPIKDTEYTVPNLKEGQEYQFRVKAVNAAGPGSPSLPTTPTVAEKPKGTCTECLLVNKYAKRHLDGHARVTMDLTRDRGQWRSFIGIHCNQITGISN